MSEQIKAVYLDSNGNQHDTKAAAKKANRLIGAATELHDALDAIEPMHRPEFMSMSNEQTLSTEPGIKPAVIEFARAVVSIYGMKDKA